VTTPRWPFRRYWLSCVLAVVFIIGWLVQGHPADWSVNLIQAASLLVLVALAFSIWAPRSRTHCATMQEALSRMEDRIDAIGFQLFEERTQRTAAERFFDERRRDPDYDQAYRQAWRALRDAPADDDGEAGTPDPHHLGKPER
jgi:hypothetical protein